MVIATCVKAPGVSIGQPDMDSLQSTMHACSRKIWQYLSLAFGGFKLVET